MTDDDADLRDYVQPLEEIIWKLLHDTWEETGHPAIVGTVLSLLMARFLSEYVLAANLSVDERAAFYEKAVQHHGEAIRKGLVTEELH